MISIELILLILAIFLFLILPPILIFCTLPKRFSLWGKLFLSTIPVWAFWVAVVLGIEHGAQWVVYLSDALQLVRIYFGM